MNRKEYLLIAKVFNKRVIVMKNENTEAADELISTASQLADMFKEANPFFNQKRFMNTVEKWSRHA